MEDILPTNPGADAVFYANDQMALGAIQAIAAHRKRGKLGGAGRGLDRGSVATIGP